MLTMEPKCTPNSIATCDGDVQIQLSGLLVFHGTIEALKMKNIHGPLIKLELEIIFTQDIQSNTVSLCCRWPLAGCQMFI